MLCTRFILAAFLSLFAGGVSAGSNPNLFLVANFDSQPTGVQIGTGGAVAGEPVSISSALQAVVVPTGVLPSPSLRIAPTATGSARFVAFEFLGSNEIATGDVYLRFVLKPAQLERFLIGVREQGGASKSFLDITMLSSGQIAINDASGLGAVIGSYTAGQNMVFEFRFYMHSASYDVYLNGNPLAIDRIHGIIDRGVGSLILGSDPASQVGSQWFLDDVRVFRPDQILSNGFE
jgi:hypothetical protein